MRTFLFFFGLLLIVFSTSQATEINQDTKNNFIRVRRATPGQFSNSHVMSQKTYDTLRNSRPENFAANFQNYLKTVDKKNPVSIKNKGHMTNDAYQTRQVHTFVVGSRKDVSNSIAKGLLLQKTKPGQILVESNKNFKLIEVRRGKGHLIPTMHDLGTRRFAAGVEHGVSGNKPVHYEAKYRGGLKGLTGNNHAPRSAPLTSLSSLHISTSPVAGQNRGRQGTKAVPRKGSGAGSTGRTVTAPVSSVIKVAPLLKVNPSGNIFTGRKRAQTSRKRTFG